MAEGHTEAPTTPERFSWADMTKGYPVAPLEISGSEESLRLEREAFIKERALLPLPGNGSTFLDEKKRTVVKFPLGETHASASVGAVQKQAAIMEKVGGRGGLPRYIGKVPAGGYEMEAIIGKSLKQINQEGEKLSSVQEEEALRLLKELHEILKRAHGDLVGNDDNIIISPSGDVHFIDIWPFEPNITLEQELTRFQAMLKNMREKSIPRETKINIPEGLEKIGVRGAVAHAFLDREKRIVYRIVDWKRLQEESTGSLGGLAAESPEYARRDFQYKVEVATKDKTGLTPQIYEYDPENGTIKMEFIDGTPFDEIKPGMINRQAALDFLMKLEEFHRIGLYHGDLSTSAHYVLAGNGEIRLLDPSWMREIEDDESLSNLQNTDTSLAKKMLMSLGVDLS